MLVVSDGEWGWWRKDGRDSAAAFNATTNPAAPVVTRVRGDGGRRGSGAEHSAEAHDRR